MKISTGSSIAYLQIQRDISGIKLNIIGFIKCYYKTWQKALVLGRYQSQKSGLHYYIKEVIIYLLTVAD